MATITLKVQELVGDPDESLVYLVAPKTALGGIAPGEAPLSAALVTTPLPTLKFLIISKTDLGGVLLPIYELTGDVDEEMAYVVAPKTLLGGAPLTPGEEYEFTEYPDALVAVVSG